MVAAGSAVAAGADITDSLEKISKPLVQEQKIRVSDWSIGIDWTLTKRPLEAAPVFGHDNPIHRHSRFPAGIRLMSDSGAKPTEAVVGSRVTAIPTSG